MEQVQGSRRIVVLTAVDISRRRGRRFTGARVRGICIWEISSGMKIGYSCISDKQDGDRRSDRDGNRCIEME